MRTVVCRKLYSTKGNTSTYTAGTSSLTPHRDMNKLLFKVLRKWPTSPTLTFATDIFVLRGEKVLARDVNYHGSRFRSNHSVVG